VTPLLDRAYSLLDQIYTCERQFPLLILACEALTDERRMDILDLVARTQKYTHVRSMDFFQRGLKCLWVQKDLHADQELKLDHTQLLRVVFSCSNTLPNLA
jgi:predicted CoA-binding protein